MGNGETTWRSVLTESLPARDWWRVATDEMFLTQSNFKHQRNCHVAHCIRFSQ